MKNNVVYFLSFISFVIYFISLYPGEYFNNTFILPYFVFNFLILSIIAYINTGKDNKYSFFNTSNIAFSVLSMIPIVGYLFIILGMINNIITGSFSFLPIYKKIFNPTFE